VIDALEVIARDEQVRSILFNIFGGITRCDEVARGILAALERVQIAVPIVVRLDGTNAEEGRRILGEASLANLHAESTMLDGAPRAVDPAAWRPAASTRTRGRPLRAGRARRNSAALRAGAPG